jgi:hypothetical protein
VLSSGEFDTFLALLRLVGADSFAVVALNDDGGGGTNSLIDVPLSAGEDYLVIANGFTYADVGAYTLTVTGRTVADLLCIRGDVAVGGSVNGTLADTDCDLGNSWFESYRLDPAAEVTVDIAMASDVFDTYLLLLRFATPDSLVLVDSDDDGGGGPNGTNSLIAGAVLSAASDYLVVANGFDYGDDGPYTVGVTATAGGAVLGPVRPGSGRWDTLVKVKPAEAGRPPAGGSFPR